MKSKKRSALIFGIFVLCFGIAFFVMGMVGYMQQVDQRDWSVATATVINVDRRRESSGAPHGYRNYRTVYDILYQYEANENIYMGEILKANAPKKLGETFPIKFNPNAPEESTKYLEPSLGFLISGIATLIAAFGLIGFFMIRKPAKSRTGRKRIKTREEQL